MMPFESGVITDAAMAFAKAEGLVFATDPTSAWACTIGGNIAENAGGKTAVLWGTAIDSLLSFIIAMPDGRFYTVRRVTTPCAGFCLENTLCLRFWTMRVSLSVK
jgi:FAD/FMN-containing dehydrogenase